MSGAAQAVDAGRAPGGRLALDGTGGALGWPAGTDHPDPAQDGTWRRGTARAGTLTASDCALYRSDAGACIAAMAERAKPGYTLIYPAPADGACIPWTTGVTLGLDVVLDLGHTHFCTARRGALLSMTGGKASVLGGRFSGTRAPGQVLLRVLGSQTLVSGLSCERFDVCVEQPKGAGFFNVYEHIFARNVATAVLHFEDGVGPVVLDMQYDTDNRAWAPSSADSFAVPIRGCLWVQTEGVMFSKLNATHCGDGLRVETNGYRHIEWLKGSDSFFDSGIGGAGVHIINAQLANKPGTSEAIRLRGVFLDNIWSATNDRGLWIEGRGVVDGVFWRNGEIHNNTAEGVRIDNPNATNIVLEQTLLSGNNAAGQGASNFFTNTAGLVVCRTCFFGRTMGWSALPYNQVITGSKQSGVLDLDGSRFDVAGVGHFVVDKHGSGPIDVRGVEGMIVRKRGSVVIPAGQVSADVSPGLNVPYDKSRIVLSADAPCQAYVTHLGESADQQTFGIALSAARDEPTTVVWDVDVDRL